MAIPSTSKEMLRFYMQLNETEQQSVLQTIKTIISGRSEHHKIITLEDYYFELESVETALDSELMLH